MILSRLTFTMQMLRAWLILCGLCACTVLAAEPIPAETQGKLDALVGRLEKAMKPGDYPMEDYFRDLAELGKSVPVELVKGAAERSEDFNTAVLRMAAETNQPGQQDKIKELVVWYGQPRHMVPRELRPDITDEQWTVARSAFAMAQIRESEPLHPQHSVAAYRVAWEAWLLSPPSTERDFLEHRATEALWTIRDDRSQPLYPRMFEWTAARGTTEAHKRTGAAAFIHLIAIVPGAATLDTLLACNRQAIAKEFNGSGVDSISRQIVRILSSRDLRADQMADPAIQEFLRAAGDKILKPEEIPTSNKDWQTYLPLLEARLADLENPPPAEDAVILQEAITAMPKAAKKVEKKTKTKRKR